MEILVKREYKKKDYTIGKMYINGEYFCDTLEDTDRGLMKIECLDEIEAAKEYGRTAIPIGKYPIAYTYSPRFKKHLPLLLQVPAFEGVRIHCLDDKTEILTTKGWKGIDTYNNEDLITYNRETQEYEVLPNIETITREVDEDLYVLEGRGINFATTDKHNHWCNVKLRNGGRRWETRTADNIPYGAKFAVSGTNNKEKLNSRFLVLYKLAFALVADGFVRKYKQGSCNVMFHFRKERKIAEIKKYLEFLGEDYTFHTNEDGTSVFSLNNELSFVLCNLLDEPNDDYRNYKLLPCKFYDLHSDDLLELLDTYLFFDGKYENYLKTNCRIINSANKQRIEQLQALAVLAGCSTYMYESKDRNGYELRYTLEQEKASEKSPQRVHYKGRVWCVSNDNETIIIRRGGRTMITQNCGNTHKDTEGCILLGENKAVGKVLNSRKMMDEFLRILKPAIEACEDIWITIK